ncbi:unnamed protein product [Phytomonas sp. Hart1]|nr:unnamed protein product [Phytomonas sp. Hart1]|eukprot:CCW69972.1 unnamed protein product [Phytomonas sp. isolate Hart1]
MASKNAELSLIKRFHMLSQDYDARPAIARCNTLPVVSRFLSNNDREVRKLCLEAVYLLSQHPDNVDLLGSELSLVNGIFHIYSEAQYNDPELYELSNLTLDTLGPGLRDGDPRHTEALRHAAEDRSVSPVENTCEPNSSSLRNSTDDMESSLGARCGLHETATAPPTHSRVWAPHMVTMEVPALHTHTDTSDLEEILQRTKGIISYTITSSAHQLRVFLFREALQPLQDALNDAGYVNLVLSNERIANQEDLGNNHHNTNKSYYDEEEKRPSYLEGVKSFASNLCKAVTLYTGNNSNTLAARVQRQREVGDQKGSRVADRLVRNIANWF